VGDEHVYYNHGGIDRAVNQYASEHYADWLYETSPHPDRFAPGAFGENLVATNMNEDNVCIGDEYHIGDTGEGRDGIILQVSKPRSPCYKLNLRFDWSRALKRVQRTARTGWNYRVLKPGWIEKGDKIWLVARPTPMWSLKNVKRVIQSKTVPMPLMAEVAGDDSGFGQQKTCDDAEALQVGEV
jgi:MOSC domain-containing protein YiiM